ncbi:hypothetical protein PR202_gb19817 [Eleusine coracana subsp. coracana]|uniref:RING-type domain-containing protein n=1 Tax=Eleusine coracana subsp. coracana TaxID=191504 RepID=A0AAV5F965_ELECO|nr:hypothetical protein PR202_gb19817 [Eleusine coracana subsp. coracana]
MLRYRRLNSDSAAPPPAAIADADTPHWRWSLHGPAVKVAIAGNVVLVVLIFGFIVWRLFFAGRDDDQEAAAAAVSPQHGELTSSSGASTPRASSPRAARGGLRKEDLLALPVFVVVEQGQGVSADERKKKMECAVCISELGDGDTGRLLPLCGHQFHAECVDRWFRSHVTCPLCRAVGVVADGGSDQHDAKVASVV